MISAGQWRPGRITEYGDERPQTVHSAHYGVRGVGSPWECTGEVRAPSSPRAERFRPAQLRVRNTLVSFEQGTRTTLEFAPVGKGADRNGSRRAGYVAATGLQPLPLAPWTRGSDLIAAAYAEEASPRSVPAPVRRLADGYLPPCAYGR